MELTLTTGAKSIRTKVSESIIESLKIYLVIKPLQLFFGKKYLQQKFDELNNCEDGTIGKAYAELLTKEGVDFIPVFQNHDLKHLILGYGMSSLDELRMQAYLLGNGNRSVFCILFLLSAVILPSSWNSLYTEYQRGKLAPSILRLKSDDCLNLKTADVRRLYNF